MELIKDSLSFEFDTLKIKIQLLKDKLNKAIIKVENIFKKVNAIIYKELLSCVSLLSFVAKLVLPCWASFWTFYNVLAKGKKYLY